MYENFLKTACPGLAETRHYHTKARTLIRAKQLAYSGEQPRLTEGATVSKWDCTSGSHADVSWVGES